MNDLNCFYSANMVIVFILMLSLATLEAQQNDKFFDLMTTIGEYFRGEFNDTKKALELDLNDANSFLKELHKFATHKIVRKNENGEFECKKYKKPDFIMAIKTILVEKSDKNVRNFLKAFLEKPSLNEVNIGKKLYKKVENFLKAKFDQIPSGSADSEKLSDKELYTIKTLLFKTSFKKVEDLLNALTVSKKSDQIPSGSDPISSGSADSVEIYSEEQLFNLLFSLAARLEAIVHGKNIDGTLKEKKENSKDKIQTFLAVPKCFIIPERETNSIFDYWIEIIEMKTKNSQKPIFGVAIYKENTTNGVTAKKKLLNSLEHLNDQKFSIYETSNLLRATFNVAYAPFNYGDKATNRADTARLGNQKHISRGEISQIFVNLLNQINSVFFFNWAIYDNYEKNRKCKDAIIFQNISENLMKMISDKGIDPKLHLDSEDNKIQEYVQKDVEESCKKFDKKEAKIIFLNNVHYELAINFEFNQRKDIYDRADDLLSEWVGDDLTYLYSGIWPLSDKLYLKENAFQMLNKIKHFTSEKTNQEKIRIIDALIGKEFNLGSLFDQIKTLSEVNS